MSTTLKITVTKEMIRKGEKRDCSKCAIALAVRDIFPQAYVEHNKFYFHVNDVGNLLSPQVSLPKKALDFLWLFDNPCTNVELLEPISFDIDIPDEILERINIDDLTPLLQNHPTLELITH